MGGWPTHSEWPIHALALGAWVGNHLHGIEIYKGKAIFYDLGNFFFNAPLTMWTLQEPMNWESVVAKLNCKGKAVPEAHAPYVSNHFMHTRALPAPAKELQAADILQRMVDLSQPFRTEVKITGETAEVLVNQ